jgi:hypothetical protein
MPLRTPGKPLYGTRALFLAALLALSPWVSAQESSGPAAGATSEEQGRDNAASQAQPPREDYYRAEFVILERIVDPADVNEKMANRIPEPTNLDITEILRAVDRNGTAETTRQLVPRSQLHLRTAANRLENSGRFRILLATGWYQSFPPDFDGEPLKVAIGDWLADAGLREVEGHITIDRQRYLHVDVHLNHWQPLSLQQATLSQSSDEAATASGNNQPMDDGAGQEATGNDQPALENDEARDSLASMATGGDIARADQTQVSSASQPKAELITWIRETRRMRSEEVHFLDSPTIGVLVFFKKVEE